MDSDRVNALIVVARFIQVAGFSVAIVMLALEYSLSMTFGVFAINSIAFFLILIGIMVGALSLEGVLVADAIVIALSIGMFLKARSQKKLKDLIPASPKHFSRCPVCGKIIKPSDEYCALMDSKSILYFDSLEHMKEFIASPDSYRISKEINFDGVRKIAISKRDRWIEVKRGQSPLESIREVVP
ncbi:MAG: hypothetical protein ABDH18_05480 [Aquificaceae bacterium]